MMQKLILERLGVKLMNNNTEWREGIIDRICEYLQTMDTSRLNDDTLFEIWRVILNPRENKVYSIYEDALVDLSTYHKLLEQHPEYFL